MIDIAKGAALMTQTTIVVETGGYNYNKLTNVAGARVMYENLKLIGVPSFTPEEVPSRRPCRRKRKPRRRGIDTTIGLL